MRQRRDPPDLDLVLNIAKGWVAQGAVRWVAADAELLFEDVLAIIEETSGRLNFNDGLIVALQRNGNIGALATMDAGFDIVANFRRAEACEQPG